METRLLTIFDLRRRVCYAVLSFPINDSALPYVRSEEIRNHHISGLFLLFDRTVSDWFPYTCDNDITRTFAREMQTGVCLDNKSRRTDTEMAECADLFQ